MYLFYIVIDPGLLYHGLGSMYFSLYLSYIVGDPGLSGTMVFSSMFLIF